MLRVRILQHSLLFNQNLEIMAKKKFRVEVAFQGERIVTVSANNARQAQGIAHKRVRKMAIGSSVRTDWTEIDEY